MKIPSDKLLKASFAHVELDLAALSKMMTIEKQAEEDYLQGALWCGRNMTLVTEELSEELDYLKSKFLREIFSAMNDENLQRSTHRLAILANSCVSEVLEKSNLLRTRIRELLLGVSSIQPGDSYSLQDYNRKLNVLNTTRRWLQSARLI